MTTTPPMFGAAGTSLWSAVTERYDLTPHESELLASACAMRDMIARLEALLEESLTTTGSTGQVRLNAAVTELRQHRVALSRLLTDLALPADVDPDSEPVKLPSPASQRASRAAKARHDRDRRRASRTDLDAAIGE